MLEKSMDIRGTEGASSQLQMESISESLVDRTSMDMEHSMTDKGKSSMRVFGEGGKCMKNDKIIRF